MNEEQLVTLVPAAASGDKGAFQSLIDAFERRVFAVAYSYVHNFQQAEDVVQEVFLRAFLDLRKLKDSRKFAGWLGGIASHVSIDWLRKRKAMRVSLDDPKLRAIPDPAVGDPDAPAVSEEVARLVAEALSELPEQTRTCVCLRYFDDLSYAEIGETLGVPASTVRGSLYRGTKKLREDLRGVWEEMA